MNNIPIISKTELPPPRDDKFCEYLHYQKHFNDLGVTDFVRFVQILPIFAAISF